MTRYKSIAGIGATLAVLALGCSKRGDSPTTFPEAALAPLKQADLDVGPFKKTAPGPYAASDCVRGQVEKLDVLLCHYADAAAAKRATHKLETFVGTAMSGAVRQSSALLLAAADRNKSDPRGLAMQKLLSAFNSSVAPAATQEPQR